MTNLEWFISNLENKEELPAYFCRELYKSVHNKSCEEVRCIDCMFSNVGNIAKYLSEEHKSIELTRFEYDLLINCMDAINKSGRSNSIIGRWWIIEGMKDKGYFKDIGLDMTFKEVLDNCRIVGTIYKNKEQDSDEFW